MNWGNKLLVVFIVFGTLIAYLVYRCMSSSVDLVSKDYYRDELVYQNVIDGKTRAAALSSDVTIKKEPGMLSVFLPAEMKGHPVTGNIWFYCPSASEKDVKVALDIDEEAKQQIPLKSMGKGTYTMKIGWRSGGHEYFSEQPLIIP